MTNKPKYFIDLFAGCGGMSLGLEQAGFIPLLYNEINDNAATTYKNNVKDRFEPIYIKDIKELSKDMIEEFKSKWNSNGKNVDLVVGGPPCWGYSKIGIRRTFDTDKVNIGTNHLYNYMADVISNIKPKIFLFENVMGLLTARWTKDGEKGEIWENIQSTFKSIKGYSVQVELIHCYDYGVPQNRPRIIMVGIRDDLRWVDSHDKPCFGRLPNKLKKPIPTIEDTIGDLIDENYQDSLITRKYPQSCGTSEIQRELRKGSNEKPLRKGALVKNHKYSNHSQKIVDKFKYMIKNDSEIPENMKTKKFAQKVLPRKWLNGKPNITVTSLPDDYVHYCQPRSLTVREWARLQTFPDNFIFHGPRTTGGRRRAGEPENNFETRDIPQYTQIGNAVPVRMAKEFGKHFIEIINNG